MTDRTDVARGRDIVARWCGLAEQRLEHLTELFETGRWRRYHSEVVFLENIREAKSAVETWRGLLDREATADNLAVDLSWIGRRSSVPPVMREVRAEAIPETAPRLAELPVAPPVSVAPAMAEAELAPKPKLELELEPEAEPEPVLALDPVEAAEESALDVALALTLDIVGMARRYPSLRNAFQSLEKN